MFYGVNHYKTNPNLLMNGRNNDFFSSTHAEMDAILKAKNCLGIAFDKHVKKMKIYVIRINRDGKVVNAKPCKFCEQNLINYGLKKKNIYYSDSEGNILSLKENDEH